MSRFEQREPVKSGDLAMVIYIHPLRAKDNLPSVVLVAETAESAPNSFRLKYPDSKKYVMSSEDMYAITYQNNLLKISGYDDREVTEPRERARRDKVKA